MIVENARDLTYYTGNDAETWSPDWCPVSVNQSHVINGYAGEISHFIDCIKNRAKPRPDIDDGLKALEIIYEITEQIDIPPVWKQVPSGK